MQYWFRLALLCACFSCWASSLGAQQPILNSATGEITPIAVSSTTADEQPAEDSTQTKREEIADKLRVAQRTLDTAKETSEQNNTKPPERLQREVELLKQLEVVVAQLEAAKTEHADLKTRLGDLQTQLEAIRDSGPPEEPPYSFLLLDQLRDELAARQARTETVEAAAASAGESVARAKQASETKAQAHRRAKELEQSNADDAKKAELANATKAADLEAQIAAEAVNLKKQEQANQQVSQQLHIAQVELLQQKVEWIGKAAVFSDRDLQEQMIEIDKQEEDLRNELRLAEANLQYAEGEWSRARQQLDATMDRDAELSEQVNAKQLARQLYQTQVSQLNVRLQRRGANREVWQQRFAVIRHTATTDDLITWGDAARTRLDQLEREKRLEQMRIDELRQDIAGRDKKLQGADGEAARRWIEEQRDTSRQLIQVHDANIVSIEASRRPTEKLIGEIEGDVKQWTFTEWADTFRHYAGKVWNMELTTVDDHPLTIGKVLVGVILLFSGFILARMLSRTLGYRLQHGRFHLNESGASALQSLSFYVFLVCFTLTALKFVNVPLTMFTFFGGAIAIGVGFGSQNILNNFISGLILLAERPIRVGDLIQLEGLHGTVEHIGTRSTRVRTANNMEIIVPNSSFLENNVLNLTLADNKVRTCVSVGLAYGSPTREAARLLKHAAEEHGVVLTNPEPFVWFVEFGDNSLNFELHFWVEVRNLSERKRIESDLRFKIDQLFREAGIVIAFPQRDIHFNATRPIPVQMFPPDTSGDVTVRSDAA